MNLIDFLQKVGDEKAARLFGVAPRTVRSWRVGARSPRKRTAAVIVKRSPVTYAGIYGDK
jgi:DNA-binding transcriptional regulator YiaG